MAKNVSPRYLTYERGKFRNSPHSHIALQSKTSSCSGCLQPSGVREDFLSKYTVKYYNYFLSIFKKMLYY